MPALRSLPDHFIKVCGVTRESDLRALAAARIPAVGLNFVTTSPRYVEPPLARQLSRLAQELGLLRVGVVLDPSPGGLADLLDKVELDALQLHGSESPAIQAACRELPLIKAVTWSGRSAEQTLVEEWSSVDQLIAFLVDAFVPGQAGGTGKTARWDLLAPRPACLGGLPLILAGGLHARNVAEAIAATHCQGVDAASGVESQAGIKDAEQVASFARHARSAWAELSGGQASS